MNKLNKRFWFSLCLFGLIGQIAWTVENMYLNVYIYNMFHASANDISLMVSLSSIVATITTIIMGSVCDKTGKRKVFISAGYILWGLSLFAFSFVSESFISSYIKDIARVNSVCIMVVIILDCIMTFFGSTANDAAFNAWICDKGEFNARGQIEGIVSIMPLLSVLIVFGSFMFFDLKLYSSWNMIFKILGTITLVCGLLGFMFIDEHKVGKQKESYFELVSYGFRKDVINNHKMLYGCLLLFALFSISIQVFMPYLILYYEHYLKLANYVIIFAPAVIIAGIFTVFYSRLYDVAGFQIAVLPSTIILMLSYVVLYLGKTPALAFIGTLLMMMGYMSGISVYGAAIRDRIPANKNGQFQGIRIIFQVLIPGVIGPMIGATVLKNAQMIMNNDGTYSFIPNGNIFIAALIVMFILCIVLKLVFKMVQTSHYDLYSNEGEKIKGTQDTNWNVYPRPQLRREYYMLLNGIWDLDGHEIKVPFAPQSLLSEYKGKIKDEMTYKKIFTIPENFKKDKIIIHFDAVDQIADVYINNHYVGHHEGGYLRFSFDITDYVYKDQENTLIVKIKDDLNHLYPYGKQTKNRGGMWYTPVSGIYKSVWIENVNEQYIEKIVITPDLKGIDLKVIGNICSFKVEIDGNVYESFSENIRIDIDNPKLWDCEYPYLYNIKIISEHDEVESYFALRTIQIKEIDGIQRVCLNDKPIFLHGVLDQGYYCDGLFTPSHECCYDEDILNMKELGFNMIRKHIKVEPDYFYYACDKHGMLVMQDMVNNGSYSFIRDTVIPTYISKKRDDTKADINSKQCQFFIEHAKQTILDLYNFPSIISFCIFNEGWGQFHSDILYNIVKDLDSSRIIDSTSGWYHQNNNDFDSEHIYFKKIELKPLSRPYLVSECGGFTMKCDEHIYSKYNVYGYGVCENTDVLTSKIEDLYDTMIYQGIKKGVCGCVYTQVSDVEDEINGLYTYDRKICKVDKERMKLLSERLLNELKD